MRLSRLAGTALLVAAVTPPAGFAIACAVPLDFTSAAAELGPNVVRAKNGVAWRAHSLLGGGLEAAGCSRNAVGLQWIKAAAHAPNGDGVRRAGAAMAAARARGDATAYDDYLCGKLHGRFANRDQKEAAALAGLACADLPAAGGG